MPAVGVPLWLALVLAVLVVTCVVALVAAWRWRRFSHGLGAFRCLVRLPGEQGASAGWRRGVARFDPGALRWFPAYTLLASRSLVLERSELELSAHRSAGGSGPVTGLTVLHGTIRGRPVELAVPPSSASALVLWAESGPPGRGVNVA